MASLSRLSDIGIEEVKGLGGRRGQAMRKAGVHTVADLLMHVPRRYLDRSRSVPIAEVPIGQDEATVLATVTSVSVRRPRKRMVIVEAVLTDGTSTIRAVWFNQPYRARQLSADVEVALSGKVERFRGKLQMKSPVVDVLSSPKESLVTGRVVPIHPATGEASPGVLRRAIHNALARSRPIDDTIPESIVARAGVGERDRSFADIHFPEAVEDALPARDRLVFDELFRLEVALAMRKKRQEADSTGMSHPSGSVLRQAFLDGLSYRLTGAQSRVLAEIDADLAGSRPMHRLLQGEVGSGKTVVAVAALLTAIEGGWQGAVMAPTEVLSEQHYLGIVDLLSGAGLNPDILGEEADLGMESLFVAADRPTVTVALLTGTRALMSNRPGASRDEVLRAIADGEAQLLIGTHALIQEGVVFHRLGVAVVDEQHRFGVAQRVELRDKASGIDPDLLIMTATPIPRTLSMTLYGDLDVSVIDEMPPGRSPVETIWLTPGNQGRAWEKVVSEVRQGRQAFVVCPLVDDSPKVEAASATQEFERLGGVLEGIRLGLIHGQLHPREKEQVMAGFRAGDIDVLVATTVIEVGIDVPNATVMVIEDANRFGLSQLHQLRGRVGRGSHGSTCILIAEPTTQVGEDRVRAMVATNDGFELANEDLKIRGQGTVFGLRQSGITDLRLADVLRDFKLLEVARREAFALVDDDPTLAAYPELAKEIRSLLGEEVDWLFAEARA